MDKPSNLRHEILKEIVESLKKMNYGELVITVHDSEIVQIEKREKKRFTMKGGRQEK
jgi:hypothetical protein